MNLIDFHPSEALQKLGFTQRYLKREVGDCAHFEFFNLSADRRIHLALYAGYSQDEQTWWLTYRNGRRIAGDCEWSTLDQLYTKIEELQAAFSGGAR